jgi:hypothetical protein
LQCGDTPGDGAYRQGGVFIGLTSAATLTDHNYTSCTVTSRGAAIMSGEYFSPPCFFTVTYMTAVDCTGSSIVFSGSYVVRCSLSNANIVNNAAQDYIGDSVSGSIMKGQTYGIELTEVIFQGNSGPDLGWGSGQLPDTDSKRFVLNGCFFDKEPDSTYYQISGAIFTVGSSTATFVVAALGPALCILPASPSATPTISQTATPFPTLSATFVHTGAFSLSSGQESTVRFSPSSPHSPTHRFSMSDRHELTLRFLQSSPHVQTGTFSLSQLPFLRSLSFSSSESCSNPESSTNRGLSVTDSFTVNFRFGIRHCGTAFVFRASIFFFPFPFWT